MSDDAITGFDWAPRLESWLRAHVGEARVLGIRPLTGGACQDNFRVELELAGAPRRMALRSDARRSLPGSLDRATEFAVIRAAVAAGVRTPEAHWLIPDLLRPGSSAYLMDWVDGVAIGAIVLREPTLAEARRRLPEQLAEVLAAIHRVTPEQAPELAIPTPQSAAPRSDGAALGAVEASLRLCRGLMDELVEAHPAMELVLRWLTDHAPAEGPPVLVHGDYRTGNFMVGPEGLVAVLDWEFAHWGAPEADIAWLCVRDWRFGRLDRPVGGFARREPFYRAYEAASGRAVDPAVVHWWEIMGNLRWAAGAVCQSERVLSGKEGDVELLAIGRRAAEMEYEALRLVARGPAPREG